MVFPIQINQIVEKLNFLLIGKNHCDWKILILLILKVILWCSSTTSATPEFQGRGGEDLAIEIVNTLYSLYSDENFDYKQLCIAPGKKCWLMNIDVAVRIDASLNHILRTVFIVTLYSLASWMLWQSIWFNSFSNKICIKHSTFTKINCKIGWWRWC